MEIHAKHLPADERRAVTVNAVLELAAQNVPSDITTAAIAKQMGVTQGSLFRHFPSKDAIWEYVMGWVADKLLERVDAAAAHIDSPLDALKAMFMGHVDFAVEHPGVPRMMFGELQRTGDSLPRRMVRTLLGRYGERLQQLFAQGKAEGEIDSDLDAEAAATLFIGTIQGLVMQSMLSGDVERIRRDAPRVFAIYQRGIRSTP